MIATKHLNPRKNPSASAEYDYRNSLKIRSEKFSKAQIKHFEALVNSNGGCQILEDHEIDGLFIDGKVAESNGKLEQEIEKRKVLEQELKALSTMVSEMKAREGSNASPDDVLMTVGNFKQIYYSKLKDFEKHAKEKLLLENARKRPRTDFGGLEIIHGGDTGEFITGEDCRTMIKHELEKVERNAMLVDERINVNDLRLKTLGELSTIRNKKVKSVDMRVSFRCFLSPSFSSHCLSHPITVDRCLLRENRQTGKQNRGQSLNKYCQNL